MDVSCAHAPCVEGYHFFLYPGNIPLVFWDQFWLKFPFPVPWDIDLELTILTLQCFRGMSISLIGCRSLSFLILFITERRIQFCLHEFLKDILEAVSEQAVDISYAV